MNYLSKYKNEILKLCELHKVSKLYAFGSVLTDRFNEDSDLDFIVEFLPLDVLDYADNYFEFKFSLEKLLNRTIDLLEDNAITNPFFRKNIDQQKRLIYGHRDYDLVV